MKLTSRTLIAILLVAAMAVLGTACSESDANAMTRIAGDFIIAVVTGNGELLETTVSPDLASEHPEYFVSPDDRPDISTDYRWEGDVLTITFGDGGEATLVAAEGDESVVIGTFPDGSETAISLEDTDDGWRVTEVDGMAVGELLGIAMGDMETLEDSVDQDICFTGQLTVELAAETIATTNGEVSLDAADYIPDFMAEPYFCPAGVSQYSDANSEFGYIEGLGEDGIVAPCSVHGYYDAP